MDPLEEMRNKFTVLKESVIKQKAVDPFINYRERGFVKGAEVKIYNRKYPKGYLNYLPGRKWYSERIDGIHGFKETIKGFFFHDDEIYVSLTGLNPEDYVNIKCLKLLKKDQNENNSTIINTAVDVHKP